MAMMWTNIVTIFSVEPRVFLLNVFLLICEAVSAGCVAAGIVWESGEYGENKKRIAHSMVMYGVVAEVAFSLFLFISDEIVSGSQLLTIQMQQYKIELLENRLAPRILSERQIADISKLLKSFAGTRFDSAFDLYSGEQNAFWGLLQPAIVAAGWKNIPWDEGRTVPNWIYGSAASKQQRLKFPSSASAIVFDVNVYVFPEYRDQLGGAASALIAALNSAGIVAAPADSDVQVSNVNKDAIHILIGEKR